MSTVDLERVREALQQVVDPCSVGRGVPAGLSDMGMVKGVGLDSTSTGRSTVTVELRITSPACTFQPYFEREVRERLDTIEASTRSGSNGTRTFDWSDDDMSPVAEATPARKATEAAGDGRRELAPGASAVD